MNNKNLPWIVLLAWLTIAICYVSYTPFYHRSHDFFGHVGYTYIIVNEKRIPDFSETGEAKQPPLYYLINSVIAPKGLKLVKESGIRDYGIKHVNYIRYMSVLYGAISLLIISWFTGHVTSNPAIRLLVLLFISTTPKFVFVFSTYNNDSLATLLSIAILGLSYKLFLKWSKKMALCLLLVATAALYTKYTTLVCMVILSIFCCKDLLKKQLPSKTQVYLLLIFLLSFIFYTPWEIIHNEQLIKRLTPKYSKERIKSNINILIRSSNESEPNYKHKWNEPWVYPQSKVNYPATKKYDYLAFSFVTSVIGEYKLKQPDVSVIKTILWIHLIAYLYAMKAIFKSNLTKVAILIILFTHFLTSNWFNLFIHKPITRTPSVMDYRYIAWNWVPWATLYISSLSDKSIASSILSKILIVGIILQIYILLTIEGGL